MIVVVTASLLDLGHEIHHPTTSTYVMRVLREYGPKFRFLGRIPWPLKILTHLKIIATEQLAALTENCWASLLFHRLLYDESRNGTIKATGTLGDESEWCLL